MTSIIIPAHNEEYVIDDALTSVLNSFDTGNLDVIVVCNGCTDGTAERVRSYPTVRLIETPVASKANALNLGDKAAKSYPRFYMDADIRLSANAISALRNELDKGRYLAGSPAVHMDFGKASSAVRGYYKTWLSLPSCTNGMVGAGIYALSKRGRQRFVEFPSVIADDGYVRSLFSVDERVCVEEAYALVRAPANLKSLIMIKTRSRLGGYELRTKYPHLSVNVEGENRLALLAMFRQLFRWPQLLSYLLVNIVSRMRARRLLRHSGFSGWERDDTTRRGAA